MRDLNTVEILGTVSREVKLNKSAKGLSIANIPVATKVTRQGGTEISTYHTIVCFGELADMAAGFSVGDRVFVNGSIQNESYEKDGQKVYVTKIKASCLAKLASEAEDTAPSAQSGGAAPENFPRGEAKSSFPFFDNKNQINWSAPGPNDKNCSPIVEKGGVHMTCAWVDPKDPTKGGTVYGMRDGEDNWIKLNDIPNTQDIPF